MPVVLQTRALVQSVDAKCKAGLTMYFTQVVRLERVNVFKSRITNQKVYRHSLKTQKA